MTQKEIIEGNKLIARFVGGKFYEEVNFPMHENEIWVPMHGFCRYDTVELGKGKILEYHNSWDWLMPVVEKIESLNNFKNSVVIYKDWVSINVHISKEPNKYFESKKYKDKLYNTWKVCIEFIKWYNSQ